MFKELKMENSNIVSGKCPQCGGVMTHSGTEMSCPYCGYVVANLDQNVNVNQHVSGEINVNQHLTQDVYVTNVNKPQYDFILHMTGKQDSEIIKYTIINLDTGAVVFKGRGKVTPAGNNYEHSLDTGNYEIRISKYKRQIYVDDMHTVDMDFIRTGMVSHINVRGELSPEKRGQATTTRTQTYAAPAAQPTQPVQQVQQQSAEQPTVNTNVTQPKAESKQGGRKKVFLILGIVFGVTGIYAIFEGAENVGAVVVCILLAVVFLAIYFKKEISEFIKDKMGKM